MLKNISQLEYVIGNKIYRFLCDHDSELSHVKEALCQFLKYCGNIEDQVKAQQAAQAAEASQEEAAPNEFPEPQEVPKSE